MESSKDSVNRIEPGKRRRERHIEREKGTERERENQTD